MASDWYVDGRADGWAWVPRTEFRSLRYGPSGFAFGYAVTSRASGRDDSKGRGQAVGMTVRGGAIRRTAWLVCGAAVPAAGPGGGQAPLEPMTNHR
jgi:hypothetical protein